MPKKPKIGPSNAEKSAKNENLVNPNIQMKDYPKMMPQTHFWTIWTKIGGGDRFFVRKLAIFSIIGISHTFRDTTPYVLSRQNSTVGS